MSNSVGSTGHGTTADSDSTADPILRTEDLVKHFPVSEGFLASLAGGKKRYVHAVEDVSIELSRNETVGLVGESGCGKSTLGRTILRLEEPTSGRILFDGKDITHISKRNLREQRGRMQFIHQDPSSSLNPRKRIGQILDRPLQLHSELDESGRKDKIEEFLDTVGMDARQRHRYPHELSGGQRQRVEIARAISVDPALLVADEPTSALDVTVQAQILKLLDSLKRDFELSMLFISHDLRTVRHIADKVGVMYLGELVEFGPVDEVFEAPCHPYTQSLLSSIPTVQEQPRSRITLEGEPPNPVDPPEGCRFNPRCPVAKERCSTDSPTDYHVNEDHHHRCHFTDADIHAGQASVPVGSEPGGDADD
jgi:oligopeptide transport system ATP-binding protein